MTGKNERGKTPRNNHARRFMLGYHWRMFRELEAGFNTCQSRQPRIPDPQVCLAKALQMGEEDEGVVGEKNVRGRQKASGAKSGTAKGKGKSAVARSKSRSRSRSVTTDIVSDYETELDTDAGQSEAEETEAESMDEMDVDRDVKPLVCGIFSFVLYC